MDFVIDIAFVLATVAFFKERLSLKGYWPLVAAFASVLFVAFLPDLVALFPQSAYAVEKVVTIIKLFLTAPGLFDLFSDIAGRGSPSVNIMTQESDEDYAPSE